MGFEKFSGSPRVRDYLTSAFLQKTVPHAFLISGTDVEEKKELAKLLATAIVCTGDIAPCGECTSCKKASAGYHPDILWKECESASIKVDEIREIRRDAYILPNDGEKKVYVINNADKMTQEAQDALLKILEEPPRFTTFVLLCYNHNSLLATVLSRVTHLKLQEKTGGENPDEDVKEAARAILSAIGERSELSVLKAFIDCEKKKRDEMNEIINYLILLLRDCAISITGNSTLLCNEKMCVEVSKNLSIGEILKIIDVLTDARAQISRNVGVAHVVAKSAVQISGPLI